MNQDSRLSGPQRRVSSTEMDLSTPALEFLHCMIKLLQEPDSLFEKYERSNPNEHPEIFNNTHNNSANNTMMKTGCYWRPRSLLAMLKPSLFQFFQTGFIMASK